MRCWLAYRYEVLAQNVYNTYPTQEACAPDDADYYYTRTAPTRQHHELDRTDRGHVICSLKDLHHEVGIRNLPAV